MPQATETSDGVMQLECRSDWDDCQKKQMCAKVAALNKAAPLKKREVSPATKRVKASWQKKYARECPAATGIANPSPVWPDFAKPKGGDGEYADPCAKTNGKPLQADHVVDTQWGGHPKGPFQWLDASVNTSIGAQMNRDVSGATGFKASCCP